MPQQGLFQSVYSRLLLDIEGIYRRANAEAKHAVNLVLVKAYWAIGKRIVIVEQKNKLHARYGTALLENLSKDLSKKYGSGFSETNLRFMRRFYIAYPIQQAPAELDWTLYQILSTIEDKKNRALYERKAVKEDWSSRELTARLREDGINRVSLDGHRPLPLTPSPFTLDPKLSAQRGRFYTYRLAQARTPLSRGVAFIDCGFRFWYPVKCALKPLAKGAVLETVAGDGSFEVVPSSRGEGDLYTYQARLVEVVDADTLWTEIDLGFGGVTLQKLRLRGIDCPEVTTAAGRRAKRFVAKLLKPCPFIIVKTYKDQTDKYDRYLTDVYFKQGEPDPAKVAAQGEFLNQRLLDEGLARVYRD